MYESLKTHADQFYKLKYIINMKQKKKYMKQTLLYYADIEILNLDTINTWSNCNL